MTDDRTKQVGLNSVDFYRVSSACSPDEFLSTAKVYARNVVSKHGLDVGVSDLEWEVSRRAKRRAGAVKRRGGEPIGISLTWKYFQEKGWEEIAATIRHELIHVHLINQYNDHSHGEKFRKLADQLDTHIRCEMFCDPEWWVVCEDCDVRIPRYRKSKLIKRPGKYQCGNCGGNFIIENNSKKIIDYN